jgi:hypothetical protein
MCFVDEGQGTGVFFLFQVDFCVSRMLLLLSLFVVVIRGDLIGECELLIWKEGVRYSSVVSREPLAAERRDCVYLGHDDGGEMRTRVIGRKFRSNAIFCFVHF